MTEVRQAVVGQQIETVENADRIAETEFGALFHEARTTTREKPGTSGYSSVVVQVRVRDGEFETHDEVVKTRQGETLRGTGAWDGTVSLPVRPFMETDTARSELLVQLRHLRKWYSQVDA